jgi:hypothetical protein
MGSSSKPQTVNNITQYPAWMEGPMRANIERANELADQRDAAGYQGYSVNDRIAPMNDLQQQAMQRAGASSGSWAPFLQGAAGGLAQANDLASQAATRPMNSYSMNAAYAGPSAQVQAGQLGGMNLQQYTNPWADQVTRNALGNLQEQRQVTQLQNADAAAKAKAFGGSRHAVVEAQTNAGFGKAASDLALNSAAQGYQNAQQMGMADINRNLQAQGMNQNAWNQQNQFNAGLAQQANQFNAGQAQDADLAMRNFGLNAADTLGRNAGQWGSLASQYQQFNANDINNLMTAGNMQQDHDQSIRDYNYQNFINQQNFPLENLGIRQSAVTNTPYQPGNSQTSQIYRNRTSGFLGGAQQGYGATNSWWGALAGGLLGAYG